MAYLDIRCPHCGATGRVHNESNSAFLMGRCPVCGGYVVYFCGAALPIDEEVLQSHSLELIRDHIIEQIDMFLSERITGFLEEYAEELDIDVSADVRFEAVARGEAEADEEFHERFEPVDDAVDTAHVEPQIDEPEHTCITAEEVRDFVEIDLHLIDQSWYFEKYFG